MKLSIDWIFDHIAADWQSINIDELMSKFNCITAEIEEVVPISIDTKPLFVCQVTEVAAGSIIMTCSENKKTYTLRGRDEATVGDWYMVYDAQDPQEEARWATPLDMCSEKEGLLPALMVTDAEANGEWKKNIASKDYILDIDNKSITNRPDLWGHRGFAREVAAIMNLPFKPLEEFVADVPVESHAKKAGAHENMPYSIAINAPVCRRFAGMYLPDAAYKPSSIVMTSRLLRVDTRAISFYVDLTNYVMLDISEPMHAFDANDLPARSVSARMAKDGEKLELLDGSTIELTSEDCVIADGKKAVSLAGIMGGKNTGVSPSTKSVFLEAANFDAGMIRKSAARHKVRTEASARFEKSLDPNLNTVAIERFLKLLEQHGIAYPAEQPIVSIGALAEPQTITLSMGFIDKRIGMSIPQEFVIKVLEKIGFGVTADGEMLSVVVPTYRGTKDVTIPEDIVEEVARFWGYNNIPYVLPAFPMRPNSTFDVLTKRSIKNHMAFALHMHEVNNYAFSDEDWLRKLSFDPQNAIYAMNPLSQNAQRLATSLVPTILKNVSMNSTLCDHVRLFEWARRWWRTGDEAHEQHTLAAVAWSEKSLDFYELKQEVVSLFNLLKLPVEWRKPQGDLAPWYDKNQTAELYHNDTAIGTVGMGDTAFTSAAVEGMTFIVEIDATYLLTHEPAPMQFTGMAKYPHVSLDVSALIPLEISVAQLKKELSEVDGRIYDVQLQDIFEKPEWGDKRSVTMRYLVRDTSKTLEKPEIDALQESIAERVHDIGGQVR